MRRNRLLSIIMMAAGLAAQAGAASFGTVVPVGGHVSDIALDEWRNRLYLANFTAQRIEGLSLAGNTIPSSINAPAQPGSMSLPRDTRYLLTTNYANPVAISRGSITLIDLSANMQQTFA